MKDDRFSKLALLIPAVLLFASGQCQQADGKLEKALLAQGEDSDQSSGTITPEKIRAVVEIYLRQKWQPTGGAEGATATIRFVIDKSGQVFGDPSVKTSGGGAEFDNAAVNAIKSVGPLPALPTYLGDSIAFIAKFHAGKGAWMELNVDENGSQSGMSSTSAIRNAPDSASATAVSLDASSASLDGSTGSTASGGTGQSGWTQPSGSATGQSGWTQPSGSATGQSGWTQPSGSATGQSGWTQPSGSATGQSGWTQPSGLASGQSGLTQPSSERANNMPGGNQPVGSKKESSTPSQPSQVSTTSGMQNPSEEMSQQVILLNNKAVVAIADNNYELAIKHLEDALKIDSKYQQARANLAIAYNNYGLQLKDRPDEAIKVFHKALAFDPANEKTKTNLDTIIQYMGKNPKVFKDRLDLGNKAIAQGDKLGARIEWEAALSIKPDPIVQQKLSALMSGTSPNGTPDDPRRHHGIQQGHSITAGAPQNNASATGMQTKPPNKAAAGKAGVPVRPAAVPGSMLSGGRPAAGAIKVVPGFGTGPTAKVPQPGLGDDTMGGAPAGPVSNQLDSMYRNLKNLEVKTFGKPFDSEDILSRLSRLEKKLLGKTQAGKPMRRLDALLLLQ
ncbi:TonB C-terminal domain-containing protein [Candidatus Obscuribacterales bacterium]|nr:TonB C-terminal domain-containing protein [Candidatus Obscuribacterales bacterium]